MLAVVQDARLGTVRQGLTDFLAREVLREDVAEKWLPQVLVTVGPGKQMPAEKVGRGAAHGGGGLCRVFQFALEQDLGKNVHCAWSFCHLFLWIFCQSLQFGIWSFFS